MRWVLLASLLVTIGSNVFFMRRVARLRRKRAELERRNRDLDAFSGQVAHDLRNLLGPLELGAAMLKVRADRPEAVRDLAGRMAHTVRRSDALLDDLLQLARAGQPRDVSARASVAAVVRDAVEDLAPNARAAGARVEVQVSDATVACAPGLLHAVVVNLLGNAIKFLDGRPRREIRIAAQALGDVCEIAVEDSGPGIPDEARKKIFAPFYRAPGTRGQGSGVGLATVHRIVTACQGTIVVDSAPDRGSVFRVRLPITA
jgi:signal transduction histidine kinase